MGLCGLRKISEMSFFWNMKYFVDYTMFLLDYMDYEYYICRATTRPPRPSSTAECLRLIARLRGEQASAASWEPRPPFEATEMD